VVNRGAELAVAMPVGQVCVVYRGRRVRYRSER
jgi:hypothetical protein